MSKEQEKPAGPVRADAEGAVDQAAADAALDALDGEAARLRAELEDANDRVLRAGAELDNYRKRARREIEDERRYAAAPLIQDLLPVLDDLFRALAAAEKTPGGEGLLEGVKMTAQGLLGALARHHCRPIEALHQAFDPTYHEAISQQSAVEYEPNTVIHVVQDGYMLHDRVIRPAQVIVSTRPEP
jgi:molecular chaperone GrpE